MPESTTTYLQKLKFDAKLATSLIARYLTNTRLVILLVSLIILIGLTSFAKLPRDLNPQINIAIVIVQTALPGAGPKDVEQLVTVPIEDAVRGVSKVKTVTSSSMDSFSNTTIEFQTGVDPERARTDVQAAVDTVSNLPKDATTPKVQKLDFQNQPVWTFSVTGNDLPSLTRFSRTLRDRLKDLSSVDKVSISGLEDSEIQITLKPTAIADYNLNPQQLAGAITAALNSLPAGNLRTQNNNYALTIDPSVTEIDDLRQIKLTVGESVVNLGDIATIALRSKPDQPESYSATAQMSPTRSITFNVYRVNTIPIETAVKDSRQVTDQLIEASGNRFQLHSLIDTGDQITTQFNELQRDFLLTISLVMLVLLVFLGYRQALVAAAVTPLTFFISFTVMSMTGLSLSFISFFSLLLSLGLLVDDTIVVISAMSMYYRTGKFTPVQTALLVWKDFLTPIFTTTITTVWAFVPLLLATGIIGEFIKPIPVIVSTTLIASFFVAMFLTLPFMVIILKPDLPRRVVILIRLVFAAIVVAAVISLLPKNNPIFLLEVLAALIFLFILVQVRSHLWRQLRARLPRPRRLTTGRSWKDRFTDGFISFRTLDIRYKNAITRILASKAARLQTIAMVLIFFVFAFLLFPLGLVRNEFFPKDNAEYIYLNLELPAGSTLETTRAQSLEILKQLQPVQGLDFATVDLASAFDPNSSSGGGQGSANTALFTLKLVPKEARKLTSSDISDQLRHDFKDYSAGTLSVTELSGGPPAGADLQIKLLGDDLAQLDANADKLQDYLKTQTGVTNITKSIKPGTSKLAFTPDNTKLAAAGLGRDSVGFWLRLYASGFSPDKLKLASENDENRDITLRLSSDTQYLNDFNSLNLPTPTGPLPISSLGQLALEPNPTLITREDGKRTISVSAAVTKGYSVSTLNQGLEKYADTLNLPEGYSWKTGGVNEENNNSVNSILQAMLLSFLLIIVTMVVQFSSFRRALIVMLVIPLSISGVFIIFAISHTPLSFPALIGVLALFGIVVKNSILIVDKIVANQQLGMPFAEAIADGSASRLEAIALTSFCTIAGLIPITLSDPIWRGLGGAIIAGLTFSGTIMLFFIPVVYYFLFRQDRA